MARLAVGMVFGVVVGMFAGAACGIRADDVSSAGVAEAAPETVEAMPAVVADPEPAYGVWDRLAQCESTGNWHANTGNSYYGGLQQDLVFWRRYGGLAYAARPDLASRAAQIAVAIRGQAVQGWGAWPSCSRRLGLR